MIGTCSGILHLGYRPYATTASPNVVGSPKKARKTQENRDFRIFNEEVGAVVAGVHANPFAVLGVHEFGRQFVALHDCSRRTRTLQRPNCLHGGPHRSRRRPCKLLVQRHGRLGVKT